MARIIGVLVVAQVAVTPPTTHHTSIAVPQQQLMRSRAIVLLHLIALTSRYSTICRPNEHRCSSSKVDWTPSVRVRRSVYRLGMGLIYGMRGVLW